MFTTLTQCFPFTQLFKNFFFLHYEWRCLWFWLPCSFNALLLWVTVLFPQLHWPNGKKKNSPSSCGSFHSVTKAAGSMPWQPGLARCCEKMSVCGCRPPHLTLSRTRCLGQVLVLRQVELLSERRHIKDSYRPDFELETDYLNPVFPINKQSFN